MNFVEASLRCRLRLLAKNERAKREGRYDATIVIPGAYEDYGPLKMLDWLDSRDDHALDAAQAAHAADKSPHQAVPLVVVLAVLTVSGYHRNPELGRGVGGEAGVRPKFVHISTNSLFIAPALF